MNLSRSHLAQWFALLICALIVITPVHRLPAAVTITDFGYRHIRVGVQDHQRLSLGPRPLVVVMLNFQGGVALTNTVAFYDGIIFTNAQNVNSFHREISNGRFGWTREGYVPFSLSSQERLDIFGPSMGAPPNSQLADLLYQSNIVAKLMLSDLFDFRRYDSNSDNVIGDDELEIAVFHNDNALGHRPFGRVQPPDLPGGAPYAIEGSLTTIPQTPWGFYTIAHELSHGFGLSDLYGPGCQCLSVNMTIMAGNTGASEDETFHLDPAYKMQLGWAQPRIMDMGLGGLLTLQAAQRTNTAAPVILYANDANHSTNQFFMIEYRTTNTSMGPGYDRNVASSGLVIWQVTLDPARNITGVPSSTVTNNYDPADYTLGAPNLTRGGNQAWQGLTPNLAWSDGTSTITRIDVWPFVQGSDSITVEVLTAQDTWVDFNYTGVAENGLFLTPYKTMGGGVANASWGGTLKLKAGSRTEAAIIDKRLKLEGYLGSAVIGQ